MAFKYMLQAAGKEKKGSLAWDTGDLEILIHAIFIIAIIPIPISKKGLQRAYKSIPRKKALDMIEHSLKLLSLTALWAKLHALYTYPEIW